MRLLHIVANVLFGLGFLAGAALIWTGLDALVYGGAQLGRDLLAMPLGLAMWAVVMTTAGALARRRATGGQP